MSRRRRVADIRFTDVPQHIPLGTSAHEAYERMMYYWVFGPKTLAEFWQDVFYARYSQDVQRSWELTL